MSSRSLGLERLYELLPALYRVRDAAEGKPLEALLGVIAEQVTVLEEALDQSYDDQFVETCAEWVLPYLGDLLGVRPLSPLESDGGRSLRAYIANTMAYRRRKGTAAVLEQLAQDVTGWRARAVELFQQLATTRHLNHLRSEPPSTIDLRRANELDLLESAFDRSAHTADVRRVSAPGRGRYNIPHLGLFLWRLRAYPMERATPRTAGPGRFHFSPLGHDMPLFHLPETETEIIHLAEEANVPGPIRPLALHRDLEGFRETGGGAPAGEPAPEGSRFYGMGRSLAVYRDGAAVPPADILCMHLGDWIRRPPAGKVGIDPARGRLAFAEGEDPGEVLVSFSYGFSADLGGGPYDRQESLARRGEETRLIRVAKGTEVETLQQARSRMEEILASLGTEEAPDIVIRIEDSGLYGGIVRLQLPRRGRLVLEAADGERPTVRPVGPIRILAPAGAQVTLNGLLVSGAVRLVGELELRLVHCTLVPGGDLDPNGEPARPQALSLAAASDADRPRVRIERSITGPIRLPAEAPPLTISDSVVDAPSPGGLAIAGQGVDGSAPVLEVRRCTVLGETRARRLGLAEDSIFTDRVRIERRQQGCCRFCYLPPGSVTPRRYRCQPDLALEEAARSIGKPTAAELGEQQRRAVEALVAPGFTSTRYGAPAYAQLRHDAAREIGRGAEGRLEMGALNRLEQPRREQNLRHALDEYLRFGFEAGLFYVT